MKNQYNFGFGLILITTANLIWQYLISRYVVVKLRKGSLE